MAEPVLMCWSGGKDSAMALRAALADPTLCVEALLTTVTEGYERISMHGVRCALLEQQAAALGLPLEQVRIPMHASNAIYEEAMRQVLLRDQARGISRVIFGDLFLQDIRSYRERNLAKLGMSGIFPLWLQDTRQLAQDFIALGFRAILVCVDPRLINPSFCGREFDQSLLADLPPSADPCGENGEFHTFVYDGPLFTHPIDPAIGPRPSAVGPPCFIEPVGGMSPHVGRDVRVPRALPVGLHIVRGEVVERDGFWFCDLQPRSARRSAVVTAEGGDNERSVARPA